MLDAAACRSVRSIGPSVGITTAEGKAAVFVLAGGSGAPGIALGR